MCRLVGGPADDEVPVRGASPVAQASAVWSTAGLGGLFWVRRLPLRPTHRVCGTPVP